MNKIVRLGLAPDVGSIFCKIEYKDDELSITGVEGPLRNGNARGGCGQIEMHFTPQYIETIEPAPGWTRDSIARFMRLWRQWHLNKMRAGCEHQRASWTPKDVELVSYRLDWDANRKLELDAESDAKAQGRAINLKDPSSLKTASHYSAAAHLLLAISELKLKMFEWVVVDESRLEQKKRLVPHFETFAATAITRRVERKNTCWLRPDEHPEGILAKPCEVCGYRYGTEWKKEVVPPEVLAELAALPETDEQPAWV